VKCLRAMPVLLVLLTLSVPVTHCVCCSYHLPMLVWFTSATVYCRVTLVHAHPSILNTMSPDFHELSNRLISSPAIGVELVLNDRVQSHADGKVVLQSGTVLQCDVFIPAHSTGGNVGFMPSCTLSGMSARSSGYVDVNDFFQVRHPDYHRVFAIGDCSNFDPIKTYVRIQDQAPTLCHNVAAMVLAQPMKAHVRCKSMQGQIPGPMMVVSVFPRSLHWFPRVYLQNVLSCRCLATTTAMGWGSVRTSPPAPA
jgi:NADH dehydrogenase FAD-containing subunit